MKIRLNETRGTSNTNWLHSKHTFSFGDFYDPANVQFGALRVINEDTVKASSGFGEHSHRDMEILTYVLDGELEHKDSMGNGSVIRPGSIQRMSAGTGVSHSEWNHSKSNPVQFLQIWIIPERQGLEPGYEQKDGLDATPDTWHTIASNDRAEAGVYLNQDLVLSHAVISSEQKLPVSVGESRIAWIQVISGTCKINGSELEAGDGAAFEEAINFDIFNSSAGSEARVLWFNLKKTINVFSTLS